MPEFCILVRKAKQTTSITRALKEKQIMINLILKHKSLIIIIFPAVIRKVVLFLKRSLVLD